MARGVDTSPANFVETQGTLTNTIVSISSNPNRRGIIIGNPSDTVMTARIGGTATASAGIPVPAGNSIGFMGEHVPSAAITVFCAGSSKAYTIYEW